MVTLRSYISAEYHGAKEDSLLFRKFLHGHMVSRVKLKLNKKHGVEIVTSTGM